MSASSKVTMSGIIGSNDTQSDTVEMQCLPLYSLLLSLGNPTVDFLSLDIEGAEFQVLTNIPWESVDIRAISVETQFAGEVHFRLLTSLGYTHLADMEKVAGTAGTPAEPLAKNTLKIKFSFASR